MTANQHQLQCSFCAKTASEIKKLIEGLSNNVYICDQCVATCVDVLKDKKSTKPAADKPSSLPSPRSIKKFLDQYVIGQENAKEVLAVAVYNHYKRLEHPIIDDVEIDKANCMLIGPTGCGKTSLVHAIARILDVPIISYDVTSLTEAGYVGGDIEDTVARLLQAADFDIKKAERGIVFLDEIDKKAKHEINGTASRDVAGEGVQQGLLKLLEGTDIMVPASGRKGPNAELVKINTKNILFILGGAFIGLEKIIEKANEGSGSIGFGAKVEPTTKTTAELLRLVESEHLVKYGLIPELVGRVPIISVLDDLDEDQLMRILTEPKNALVKQYTKMFALDGIELSFDEDALRAVAKLARTRKTNGRALRGVMESRLLRMQYNLPDLREDGAEKIIVHVETITEGADAEIVYKPKKMTSITSTPVPTLSPPLVALTAK
jgi:ATP-dependent Clp protease ATP-binding subunit ClpX